VTGRRIVRVSRVVVPTFVACMAVSGTLWAGSTEAAETGSVPEGGPVTVLVLGEDGREALVPRTDPAFRRVVAELQDALERRGFRVLDEDSVAADLGWAAPSGRDKRDVLEAAKLADAAGRATTRVQAVVLFRIESSYRDLRYATRIDLHLSGEVFDTRSNRFLGAFDLPTETWTIPGRCLTATCASDAIGTRARDLATELGAALAQRLAALTPPGWDMNAGARALESVYTVTLRHFSEAEALSIIGVMTDGFPGFRGHDLLRSGAALRRYEYVTTARAGEIERWLTLLLTDMALDPQDATALSIRAGDIRIERILPRPASGSK
jgi:hypothetical protein